MRSRGATTVLAVLALTACQPGSSDTTTSPSPPGAAATSTPTAPPTPVPTPTPQPGYAVLQKSSPSASGWDVAAIYSLEHKLVARTTFAVVALPRVGAANTLEFQPQARTVPGGVLFLDGAGTVNRLATDGTVSKFTSFTLDPTQELTFAVSPAGDQLLATVITTPPTGAQGSIRVDTYTATAGQAPRQVQSKSFDASPYLDGVVQGWTADGALVMEHFVRGTQNVLPADRLLGGPLHRVNADYTMGSVLGGQDCRPVADVLRDGTVLCFDSNWQQLTVRNAAGAVSWQPPKRNSAFGPRLSPDGQKIAVDDGVFRMDGTLAFGPHTVAADNNRPLFAQGWLDNSRFFLQDYNHAGPLLLATEADPGHPTDVGVAGYFVGTV